VPLADPDHPPLFIGTISGTSADGIEACLATFDADGRPHERGHIHYPFRAGLRARILALCRAPDAAASANLDAELADTTVAAIDALLAQAGACAGEVRAVGSHGQTVCHHPHAPAPTSIQLADPHRIAVRSGIDVVADFRRGDLAAGGEGAPLAPAFHATVFRDPHETRAVINLGGMANVTLLAPGAAVRGFDTGPANVLLDAWIERHHGERFDAGGAWAAGGRVAPSLFERLRADPWFERAPPKSTGREHFDLAWLDGHLGAMATPPTAQDVQATLAELTARTVADAIRTHLPHIDRALICGGGARNRDLLQRLERHLDRAGVEDTGAYGVHPEHVEAMAFAWLAQRRIAQLPGNCPSVTGSNRDLVLGSLILAPK
jgi:anhydro-N-acetylmuramic acid kinase